MIKALFFDLDGTLLDSQRRIVRTSTEALEQCRSRGIKLFIATARPPLLDRMLSWDAATFSLFSGGVYYNGGCIILNQHKEYQPVADAVLKSVVSEVQKYETINIALQLEGEKHVFRLPLAEKDYTSWGVDAQSILGLEQAYEYKTIKVLLFQGNLIDSILPIEENLITTVEDICCGRAQFYLTDKGKCIQIMGLGINKVKGIEAIRASVGVEKNEVAVFGDDRNDIEMLSHYMHSVAMGNAGDEVKQAAKYVTMSNDDNGIAHAIRNILKLI